MNLFEKATSKYGKELSWRDKFVLVGLDSGQSDQDILRELRQEMIRRNNSDTTILNVGQQYVNTWAKRYQAL